MPRREAPWYPWVSAAGWGALVFVLLLVNTGNVVVALLVAAVVAAISWKLAQVPPEH